MFSRDLVVSPNWANATANEDFQTAFLDAARLFLAHGAIIDERAQEKLDMTADLVTMRACVAQWRHQLSQGRRVAQDSTVDENLSLLLRVPIAVFRGGPDAIDAFFNETAASEVQPQEEQVMDLAASEAAAAWRQAIEADDLDGVRTLVQRGFPLDVRWNMDATSLLLAISRRNASTAELLIQEGAALNARENGAGGEPPLVAAAVVGSLELVRMLVERGTALDALGTNGMTAILEAGWSGHLDIVQFLAERGAALRVESNCALHFTCGTANMNDSVVVEVVRSLLAYGADTEALDAERATAISWAAWRSTAEVTRCLLEHNALVNVCDKNGATPLHSCISGNGMSMDTLCLLIEHGADVNAQDKDGQTPLHLALQAKWDEAVKLLVENGAQLNVVNARGETPLYMAIASRNASLVPLLLKHGADVNVAGALNVLHRSVQLRIRELENTRLLLEHGADVTATDEDGFTVLSIVMPTWDVWGWNYRTASDWYMYEEPGPDDIGMCLQLARLFVEYGATLDDVVDDGLLVAQHGEDFAPCFRLCIQRWEQQRRA